MSDLSAIAHKAARQVRAMDNETLTESLATSLAESKQFHTRRESEHDLANIGASAFYREMIHAELSRRLDEGAFDL